VPDDPRNTLPLLSYRDERPTRRGSPLLGSTITNAGVAFAVGSVATVSLPINWDSDHEVVRLAPLAIWLPVVFVLLAIALTHPRLKGTTPGLFLGLLAGIVASVVRDWS
jgi:uncharacterized membrane protein YoaK (UPF0700 family)